MKYLPLRDFDYIASALNFSTPDCHVIGGCDVYTTKAAGNDKKLYKHIENDLESQYASLVRLSASLSPPYRSAASDDGKHHCGSHRDHGRNKRSRTVEPPEIDLSRNSPFGSLSQITARRTFAYLIATLNASHPDYDFSHFLRPSHFHKEHSLRSVIRHVDSTLQNLRPNRPPPYLAPSPVTKGSPVSTLGSIAYELWNPRMWEVIDKEMGLRQCERYSFVPDEDPFDAETGGSLWSMHYFFFNKERKRVCYLHLRALSVISHSPLAAPALVRRRRRSSKRTYGGVSIGEGAGKRASYWLGMDPLDNDIEGEYEDDDDDAIIETDEDEVDEVPMMDLDDIRSQLAEGNYPYGTIDEDDDEEMYDDYGLANSTLRPQTGSLAQSKKTDRRVRGVSEEIGEAMEI